MQVNTYTGRQRTIADYTAHGSVNGGQDGGQQSPIDSGGGCRSVVTRTWARRERPDRHSIPAAGVEVLTLLTRACTAAEGETRATDGDGIERTEHAWIVGDDSGFLCHCLGGRGDAGTDWAWRSIAISAAALDRSADHAASE